MKLVSNELDGQYACPTDHPVTCANLAPWKITEMKIEVRRWDRVCILIRGEESMWFHLSSCIVGDKDELSDWLIMKERRELLITKQYTIGATNEVS